LRHRGRSRGRAAEPPADARERLVRAARGRGGAGDHRATRKRRRTAMTSRWWMVAASLVLLAACGSAPGRPARGSEALAPNEGVEFRALFGANRAAGHRPPGPRGGAIGLADPVYLAITDDASIRKVTADGVRGTA